MKGIQLCDRKNCTGCMACRQKCKLGAVKTVTFDGFDYPVIDRDKCKKCGQCMSVCPILNKEGRKGNCHVQETTCLAVWNKTTDVRMKSSSGGVFSVLAASVLEQGGVVFGAAWNECMTLEHRGIDNIDQLDALRRSKYVQSDVRNTFNEVLDHLKSGRKVLYCGTPCQIAGLTSFLGNRAYDNLVSVDVLCQGVPSPHLFKKYIKEIEVETGWKVADANFRTKDHGWRCGLLLLLLLHEPNGLKTRYIKRVMNSNEFYNAFIKEYFMRPSCYECQFKKDYQGYYSDLTIADFWRIGNKIPLQVKDYAKGISAVIVNTDKGRKIFEECSEGMEVIERTWDEVLSNGGFYSSHKPEVNDEAFDFLQSHTWRETQDKYFPLSLRQKISISLMLTFGEENIRTIKKFFGRIK